MENYMCDMCGFWFHIPLEKIKHNGVCSRHIKICPRCRSDEIKIRE